MTPKPLVTGRYTARIQKRRKPNPDGRRRDLCDAAIQLLADDGAKGLSHLKVDRKAGVPDGTTSFYFRTRSALLRAVAERLAELDLASLQSVADSAERSTTARRLRGCRRSSSSRRQSRSCPGRRPIRADHAGHPRSGDWPRSCSRPPTNSPSCTGKSWCSCMPHGAELEPAVVDDLSNVTLTFINGLLLRFAHGDRIIDSPEQLDGILSAIATGILKSPDKGDSPNAATSRPRAAGRPCRLMRAASARVSGLARASAIWFSMTWFSTTIE